MSRWLGLGVVLLLLAGCGQSYFKIPKEEYRQKVRILGVLPLLVDEGSTVVHPDREGVFELLRRENAGKESSLVQMLREQKSYFDVRPVSGDPEALFRSLVAGSALQGAGEEIYRRYRFHPAAVSEIASREAVDGVLVVIMGGVGRTEKRWDRDRARMSFLETEYNGILASAAVLLPSGAVAWEYPLNGGAKFLNLQYPDFDEAFYNRTETIEVRPVSLAGLGRILQEKKRGLFREEPLPQLYQGLFESFVPVLKPGLFTLARTGK